MSEKDHSISFNENDKISSGKSITSSTKKDSFFFGNQTVISPDGQQIITFDPETSGIKLYGINNLSNPIGGFKSDFKHPCWSLAISNCVNDDESLIALSCFDRRTFEIHENKIESSGGSVNERDLEFSGANIQYDDPQTWIKRFKPFEQREQFEQFKLPHQLSKQLSKSHSLDKWQKSFKLLHKTIIKNYFMVYSFENRQQIIEMYSLIAGDLEMLFKRHKAPDIIRDSPIFAISQNEKCWHFVEITTKQLEGQIRIYKILDINFIDADNKLLIVLEEKEDRQRKNSRNHQIFVVWDLFTTFKNYIRQTDYPKTKKPLKMDLTYRLMNSHGEVFAIRDSEDNPNEDVDSIRDSSVKAITEIDIPTNGVDRVIYTVDGKICDQMDQMIINKVEPWHLNKNYFRISVFLDSAKSTQLIISHNTIQVWKLKYRSNYKERILEYISARNKEMKVQKLRVGEREFELRVSVPSKELHTAKIMTIHWPNNVNVLEAACRSLFVLGKKKHEHSITSFADVNRMKYLVECTQKLIRRYITKYGIFRLTSIRYPIMKYLIKSDQESLIRHILKKKIDKKNSNIYIPSLCKWKVYEDKKSSTTERSKSDLHHAIKCTQERGDSTVILKYLIDYYADNTKEYNNHGWMFTVSKAIPLLYDNNLSEFVRYLFKKPCFGITEAYTPPLHITPYDKKRGNNTSVMHSLVVKPRLASNFYHTLWFFLKDPFTSVLNLYYWFQTSSNDRKVYIAPLFDFTANPKDPNLILWVLYTIFWPRRKVINKPEEMNPFLRVIYEENGCEIYQTPTILAFLDLKWPAARRYFIPSTALVTWTQLVGLFCPGRFIYIIRSIMRIIWPFLVVMFILLNHGNDLQIPTYKINDTSNSNLYSNITIYQNVDKSSRPDNYYSHFLTSIEAVLFWTNGRWDQLDNGTVTLDEFDGANKKSRAETFRSRAKIIAKYELKVVTSKSSKKLLKDVNCNKISNEPLYENPGPTNVDEKFKNLENKFEKKFNNLENEFNKFTKKFDENLETILKTLNNLNNPK
ncbi:7437_t:CDS:10 [Diversispora eburnea]|uniref:7437_t:CDS:1 n=1 Tax=Diversispora eburnea TaxID=1213867 RepID=A0A9N9B280_9GLOM|nr:7437_t:CDS:10 [Diversispora eburnea]